MIDGTDQVAVRRTLREVGDRAADLIASIDDMNRPVPGLEWTVGQVARHVTIAIRGNAASMSGRTEEFGQFVPDVEGYPARMAATISSSLAVEPVRDAKATAEALREAVNALLTQAMQQQPGDVVQTPWYGTGATLPVAMDTRLMLGELLVHGLDISRGLGRPWALAKDEVMLVVPAILTMMPRLFIPDGARNLTATIRVRVRGGDSTGVRMQRGAIDVAPWGTLGVRADCTLLAEPVAFFLVAYGRRSQWPLIAQGRLLSYGRRPWLALSFRSHFVSP